MEKPSKAAPTFHSILSLLGELNYSWTNTETLFVHLIAGLAHVDKDVAIIIFLTLNTTRARTDLVERLAKLPRTDPACRAEILKATAEMARIQKIRNHYNHCLYAFDGPESEARTILLRIAETKDAISFGKSQRLDTETVAKIVAGIERLRTVNHDLWRIIKKWDFPF